MSLTKSPIKSKESIPFFRPTQLGLEVQEVQKAFDQGAFVGGGPFTQRAQEVLRQQTGSHSVILTPSGTASMEMAALLLGLGPGDEVIMPSFTFVTTASSVVLRGATPVFVDIRSDTLNLDEQALEAARTPKTKAVFVVHYAGVSCEMKSILSWAQSHSFSVVEDAAQAVGAKYFDRPLGAWSRFGCLSFHGTKNIHCGEGGALLVNEAQDISNAEILRDKGTNRSQFFRGEVDKYTWTKTGSSFLMSELSAAFLTPQLVEVERITAERRELFESYLKGLQHLSQNGVITLPTVPEHCFHNGHLFYVLTRNANARMSLKQHLAEQGIGSATHYVPLHSSPEGQRRGRFVGTMAVTDQVDQTLLRLPLWNGMGSRIEKVVEAVSDWGRRQ